MSQLYSKGDEIDVSAASLNELGEEILSLAIHNDEGGEVLHINLPDGLHTQLRVLQHLDLQGVETANV